MAISYLGNQFLLLVHRPRVIHHEVDPLFQFRLQLWPANNRQAARSELAPCADVFSSSSSGGGDWTGSSRVAGRGTNSFSKASDAVVRAPRPARGPMANRLKGSFIHLSSLAPRGSATRKHNMSGFCRVSRDGATTKLANVQAPRSPGSQELAECRSRLGTNRYLRTPHPWRHIKAQAADSNRLRTAGEGTRAKLSVPSDSWQSEGGLNKKPHRGRWGAWVPRARYQRGKVLVHATRASPLCR